MSNTAILIPARMESTRLPQKLLLPLGNSTVIGQCLKRVKAAQTGCPIVLCTDSSLLAKEAEKLNIESVITPKNFSSGSDRIAHVAAQRNEDFVLNVQGDEAFIEPSVIQRILQVREQSSADIVSCMTRIEDQRNWSQPAVVKVVCAPNGRALYFSRSPIPFSRGTNPQTHPVGYAHIGIYAYTRTALLRFAALTPSPLEQQEGLEQLRALENGMSIDMIELKSESLSIDTRADYKCALKRAEKE